MKIIACYCTPRYRKGFCTHTGKTGAGPDSDAGCNVNKWAFSHAAGPAELPARQISVPDWNWTNRAGGRLISFNVTALQLAHVSEPVGVLNTSVCLCTNFFFVLRSISNWPPAAVMPVRVKNSTTGAGSDSATSTLLTDFDQRRSSEAARRFSLFNTHALFVRTYVRRKDEISRL